MKKTFAIFLLSRLHISVELKFIEDPSVGFAILWTMKRLNKMILL